MFDGFEGFIGDSTQFIGNVFTIILLLIGLTLLVGILL